MEIYTCPHISTRQILLNTALAQTGGTLTALENCSESGGCGPGQSGTESASLIFCVQGISDPANMNGAVYTINLVDTAECVDKAYTLSDCVEEGIECGLVLSVFPVPI